MDNTNNSRLPEAPVSRTEHFLARLAGEPVELPEPVSREELYLKAICDNIQDFPGYVEEIVPGVVSDWLEEHLEPTEPPVDDTLSVDGAAADAKKTGDEIGDIKNAIDNFSLNPIFVLNKWEQGGINYSTGNDEPNGSSCRTIGYFVAVGDNVKVLISNPDNQTLGLREYASDGTYIGSNNISNATAINCTDGHKYRVFCSSTGTPSSVTAKFTTYNKNSFPVVFDSIDDIHTSLGNVINASMTTGYYIAKTTGTRISNASYDCTDYIEIDAGKKVTLHHLAVSTSTIGACLYDEAQTYVSDVSAPDGTDVSCTFTVPNNVKYVRASATTGTVVTVEYHDIAKYAVTAYREMNDLSKISDRLNGANILIFGDSMTDCCNITINASDETTAYSFKNPSNSYVNADSQTVYFSMWPKILKDARRTGEIRNYAKAGAHYEDMTVSVGYERQNLSYQIEVAINDKDNPNNVFSVDNFAPDIVIFNLGINDGFPNDQPTNAYSKIVADADGTIDVDATLSALDRTKFCESVMWAFLRIKKEFPYSQMFCVTPIETANKTTIPGNLRNYLKEIAERYNCIVIDASFKSGITKEFNNYNALGTYLIDGLHPNEVGQNMLARLIICEIENSYMPYGDGFNTMPT